MDGGAARRSGKDGAGQQPALPGFARTDPARPTSQQPPTDRTAWFNKLRRAVNALSPDAMDVAEAGLRACPGDPALLLLGALAAVLAGQADRALVWLKRFERKHGPDKAVVLLTALAWAGQGQALRAWTLLEQNRLLQLHHAASWFIGDREMMAWLDERLDEIRQAHHEQAQAARKAERAAMRLQAKPPREPPRAPAHTPARSPGPSVPPIPALPRLAMTLDRRFELMDADAEVWGRAGSEGAQDGLGDEAQATWFRLRAELVQLGLAEGFDELLCLPTLRGVDAHWYQVETVRKVLKQYRGRVLLADEVGLGKTVEAGMVLKEYVLRGMAERVLILVPAPLVGQWRDEMAEKFGIAFATTHDPLLRSDPAAFWAQPRLIASIATARRREHAEVLAQRDYDVVVVDEAHHLRDQSSASYRLVGSLQKRFLLLLSATPVQNSLVELYNLLTLLQPGIFRTLKDFRAAYMTPGKPREPANRDRLRDLMRGVMVRNTRALANLHLPRRHAATVRAAPDPAEAGCYAALTALCRDAGGPGGAARLAVQHLLSAAGSSPAAAAAAITRFAERHPKLPGWTALAKRYRALGPGAKEAALATLLAQNPAEKTMVFVHHRDTMTHLAEVLRRQGHAPLVFEGGMSGPEKDAAVAAFRGHVPLLLCTESGGEGRNLQFCNTLVNFDIPWNPMAIEQRIGRIDRIGQTREVFVFNLVAAGTVEDAMLRILDEKINMFELVVGEVGAILGELDDEAEFSSRVLDAWLQGTESARDAAFASLEAQLLAARTQHDDAKQLDEALFGNELDAA